MKRLIKYTKHIDLGTELAEYLKSKFYNIELDVREDGCRHYSIFHTGDEKEFNLIHREAKIWTIGYKMGFERGFEEGSAGREEAWAELEIKREATAP